MAVRRLLGKIAKYHPSSDRFETWREHLFLRATAPFSAGSPSSFAGRGRQPLLLQLALICISSLFVAQISLAADPQIDVAPRKITVGDPVELTLSMPLSGGETIIFPTDERFAPAEVIRVDTIDATGSRRTLRYTISLFEPGEKELPDLPVVTLREGISDTLWLDPGQIEVTSVVDDADTASIKDIRPPVKLPWTFKEMLPYLIGGLAGILMAIGAIIWWRKRRRDKGELLEYAPPPIPPDILAMRRLEELRVKKLWQDGRPKEYHSELTDILKEYLEASYDFNALEMTSEELISVRSQWAPNDDLFGQMRRILSLADLVKFAKLTPLPHDHEKSLELAFSFVEKSRPKRDPLVSATDRNVYPPHQSAAA